MNSMLANFLHGYTIWEGCYASVYFQVKFDQIKRFWRIHSWLMEIKALWSHIYCPIVIGLYKSCSIASPENHTGPNTLIISICLSTCCCTPIFWYQRVYLIFMLNEIKKQILSFCWLISQRCTQHGHYCDSAMEVVNLSVWLSVFLVFYNHY